MTNHFTSLVAQLARQLISPQQFSHLLTGLGFGAVSAQSVVDSVTGAQSVFQFEPFSPETPYEQWMAREGVPIHTGYSIPDVRALAVKHWDRMGAKAAFIDLEGSEGTDGAYLCEIDPGQSTHPQKFLFEEAIFVLDGDGESIVWQEGGEKQTIRWKKGAMFSPPLNVWRQHFNRGAEPARLVSFHDLPVILDLFHNTEFVFNNQFVFRDRYNNQPDYFELNESKITGGGSAALFNENERAAAKKRTIVSGFVPDVHQLELHAAKSRGLKNKGVEMVFSDNTLQTHISEFEAGSYKRAHRHGPGSQILILGGEGYSLLWNDHPQYSAAGKHMRIDWKDGSMFVPPDRWFHQHFNGGETPAKYMASTWIGGKYFAKSLGGGGRTHRLNTVSTNQGGNMVDYPDEDPAVRDMFENELAKRGIKSQMPPASHGNR
jgi:gentisate 1,2-dioxygenase